ncbi:alpha-L-fucosidase [Puteibacter caeruleilacunae]|nr:alpha-L-fucosidase [Puteibacter caeruleilacunae]
METRLNSKSLWGLLLISLLISCTSQKKKEQIEQSNELYQPTWESIAKAKPATWWEDGKFGIFIHWGPYSVAGYKLGNKGYAEAITNDMYRRPEKYKEFFMEKFGAAPPEFGYKDWVDLYKAEKWNPQQWAKLFKEAGATYVIPTGEHHDGFVNWDSDLTEWCATKKGPKRDLIGDLAKAVRGEGLKYGISYHRERHPSRFTEGFHVYDQPYPQVKEEIKNDPKCADLYGPFEYSDDFINDYVARWKEAEEKYQPDFMWIDDIPIFYSAPGDPQVTKFQNAFKGMIADYLNNAQKWGKEVYFNNKGKHLNFPETVGCREKDNMQVDTIGTRWQNPATLGVSYAYMHHEEVHDLYKTPAELIRLLVDVVSKNGNLLLNIGPRADGTIPEGMQRRLLAMGKWLKTNGEAIYSSKPWKLYGEYSGDIIEEKDVHYSNHSMRIHENEYRYTTKQGKIFVTAFQNETSPFTLSAFKNFDSNKIKSIETIDGKSVEWNISDKGLTLTPQKNSQFYLASVYRIVLK